MNVTKLKNSGINYEEGLKRFANKSELYEKYLKKFLDDPTMAQLETYLADKNYSEAFKCAHTLKGMSGNLSFDDFYKYNCDLVESLRNSQTENITEQYNLLLSSYKNIIEAIK